MHYLKQLFPARVGDGLYNYIQQVSRSRSKHKSSREISGDDLLASLELLLKEDTEKLVQPLITISTMSGTFNIEEIKMLISSCVSITKDVVKESVQYLSWKMANDYAVLLLATAFVSDLLGSDDQLKGSKEQPEVTDDDVERWLRRSPLLVQIIRQAFYQCFRITADDEFAPLLPRCKLALKSSATFVSMLDYASLLFLNQSLPYEMRCEWRLVYASAVQGESFSTLLKGCTDQGPTVLLLKDTDGHIFGGYAAVSWTPQGQFYGSSHCFLFSIQPKMAVYMPSGYNTHFMYLNHGQQTLPNGLGMGGQLEYFGLWLDNEFGTGQSHACSTYNSPQLTSTTKFNIRLVEVWAVGETKKAEQTEEPQKKGLLNMDADTKMLLEMAGKKQHSEGFKETEKDT